MIWVAFGGSGSSALMRRINKISAAARRNIKCHCRPDVVFLPDFWPAKLNRQFLGDCGFMAKPTALAIKEFKRRSGFKLDAAKSIDENMRKYVRFVRSRHLSSLLTFSAYFGFFSRNKINKVCFLIRHPLHTFGSWAKDLRHGDQLRNLGGPADPRSVEFFAKLWNAFAAEYLSLLDASLAPRLIRYEYAPADAKTHGLSGIFTHWDSQRRNYNALSSDLASMLMAATHHNFERLYDDWEI